MALRTKDGRADKGVSLARVPALVLGSILLAFGLLALLKNGDTPTGGFPDGTVNGENFLGFEVNGWTAFLTAVAGGLLLFGAAQHVLAKTMSLIVGLALGACSVIALVDGDDVLGLAAANGWTKLGWGVAAAFLLINTLMPRKGGRKHHEDHHVDRDLDVDRTREPVLPPTRRTETTHRETVAPASDGTQRIDERDGERIVGRDDIGRDDLDRDRFDERTIARGPEHTVHGDDRLTDRETTRETRIDEGSVERTGRFERGTQRDLADEREGSVADDRTRR